MINFTLAYISFLAAHAIPAAPALRRKAIDALGRQAYLIAYSALSIGLLIWLIAAALAAPTATLWTLSPALTLVPIVVMPVACILFVGGVLTPNPLSISLRLRPLDPARPGFIGITRHPILWSFSLWAASHIAPNGNVVAVSLFGGLALYALGGMWLADRRARLRLTSATWAQFAAKTSVWPFGAQISGRAEFPKFGEILPALVLGLSLYALVLLRAHEWLIGVAPLDAL